MNWGKISILVLGLFMTFIITLSVLMMKGDDQDDLIDKDYYEKGLHFDKDYQEQQQAVKDSVLPEITLSSDQLIIAFRDSVQFNLSLKRLSDAAMDKTFAGKDIRLEFSNKELLPGLWILRLNYQMNGKQYLINREISMK